MINRPHPDQYSVTLQTQYQQAVNRVRADCEKKLQDVKAPYLIRAQRLEQEADALESTSQTAANQAGMKQENVAGLFYLIIVVAGIICTGALLCDLCQLNHIGNGAGNLVDITFIIAAVATVGAIIAAAISKNVKKQGKDALGQATQRAQQLRQQAVAERKKTPPENSSIIHARDAELQNLQAKYGRLLADYTKSFESDCSELASRYVGSGALDRMVEKLTALAVKAVDEADRGPHLMMVTVPFKFNIEGMKRVVVPNPKPYTDDDVFTFERELIIPPTCPMEVLAIAQALTLSVQLNVMNQRPESPSGTIPTFKQTITWSNPNASVELNYQEPNGFYQPGKSY